MVQSKDIPTYNLLSDYICVVQRYVALPAPPLPLPSRPRCALPLPLERRDRMLAAK
jgi:hypothetical protein